MNPFIESTVARPVSQNHDDHRWSENSIDADFPANSPPEATRSDVTRGSCAPASDKDNPSRQPGITSRSNRLTTSFLAAFGLCFSLALAGALVPRSAHAVDLNRATAQELQAVRGIGPKIARTIIDERTRGGNYASLSDLSDRVKGLGSKKVSALQAAGLTLASGPASAKADTSGAAPVSGAPARTARR